MTTFHTERIPIAGAMELPYHDNAYFIEGAKPLKNLENSSYGAGDKITEIKLKHLNSGKRIKVKCWKAQKWPYATWKGYVIVFGKPISGKQFMDRMYYSCNLNQPHYIFESVDEAKTCADPTSDEEYTL